jgi:hypothetical protein
VTSDRRSSLRQLLLSLAWLLLLCDRDALREGMVRREITGYRQ